jgi:serine/threonine-protein kinase
VDSSRLLAERYSLIAPLSDDDRSVVWRAHDEVLGRRVVVRVFAAGADPDLRRRIRDGATAAGLIAHPNVAAVYDCGEAGAGAGAPPGEAPSGDGEGAVEPFVVAELVDGTPLAERLREEGPLPWRVAAETCAEAAAALSAIHARGLVHGTVNVANIVIALPGVKITDLGRYGTRAPDGATVTDGAAEAEGAAADVHALGLVLYQALGGAAADTAEDRSAWLWAAVGATPGLPAAVVSICEGCLNPVPADRPTSAEVARRLAAAVRLRIAVVDPAASKSTP